MENGYDDVKLADKFSGLAVTASNLVDNDNDRNSHNNNDSLYQVIKAVESAEATIKQQVEENTRLRNELQSKILELDRYVWFSFFFFFFLFFFKLNKNSLNSERLH